MAHYSFRSFLVACWLGAYTWCGYDTCVRMLGIEPWLASIFMLVMVGLLFKPELFYSHLHQLMFYFFGSYMGLSRYMRGEWNLWQTAIFMVPLLYISACWFSQYLAGKPEE